MSQKRVRARNRTRPNIDAFQENLTAYLSGLMQLLTKTTILASLIITYRSIRLIKAINYNDPFSQKGKPKSLIGNCSFRPTYGLRYSPRTQVHHTNCQKPSQSQRPMCLSMPTSQDREPSNFIWNPLFNLLRQKWIDALILKESNCDTFLCNH